MGRLSVAMWVVVLGTVLWITAAGLWNFDVHRVLDFPPDAFASPRGFFFGLGGATLIAMYDYGGYNNVCFFAGEVRRPERVIPRSILLSIAVVGSLYLTMNITIIGVIPWREAIRSTYIVSDFIQRLYGLRAAPDRHGSGALDDVCVDLRRTARPFARSLRRGGGRAVFSARSPGCIRPKHFRPSRSSSSVLPRPRRACLTWTFLSTH